MVYRVYVEKRSPFDIQAQRLGHELRHVLGISGLDGVRLINRYDVEGISEEMFRRSVSSILSEPQTDDASDEMPPHDEKATVFAVEYLPGQFDQRASSASECIQLLSQGECPVVASAIVYVLEGDLSEDDVRRIKRYIINPVDSREASLESRETLAQASPQPEQVETLSGFRSLDKEGLARLIEERGLAMDRADLAFCQKYFKKEKRDPTITEIKVIDTYWSDHCRHTTFGTELTKVDIDDEQVRMAFDRYLRLRRSLKCDDRPITLMDMATIGARWLKSTGHLEGLDESDEINACTVKAKVDVDGSEEDWLLLFKNETHNHPTEIEPFGGAATCIGGAIRDPLAGRGYVYQAMRVSGAADPTAPAKDTLPGKLPQRKIVCTAADGYSSYGNQIGLATGQVCELYHPGYLAKHMEVGAVIGAVPARHVRREEPLMGDAVILLGGRTGRDGIGGATGSSKAHKKESLESCGAEVQKGNAPEERKLQRLFRRKDVCRLIKRCNDFGAGGVSVAIGELADGVRIDLDKVPRKYEGLDGTELAISESQERMAVVVAAEDASTLIRYATEENLEATAVATITNSPRLRMDWRGHTIVDLSRDFLSSNGATRRQAAHVEKQGSWAPSWPGETLGERLRALVGDLNIACNKGLAERFDSTIGAGTVLMPYGGKRQLTPALAMVAKLPVQGETTTCSGMAWGFNPQLSSENQFTGAYLAVIESVSKLVATGFVHDDAYLSFQEYFGRLRKDRRRWGQPMASLLGALMAQIDLGIASIGGKDSMSGSFEELDVPPTLISFAVAVGSTERIVSPEFKDANHDVIAIVPHYRADGVTPEPSSLVEAYRLVERLTAEDRAASVSTIGRGGVAEAIAKSCFGNGLGMTLDDAFDPEALTALSYGSFVVELVDDAEPPSSSGLVSVARLGTTTAAYELVTGTETIPLAEVQETWESALEDVFPFRSPTRKADEESLPPLNFRIASHPDAPRHTPMLGKAKPRVIIPVFPGTNCEYDTQRAFERAGAVATTLVINNLTPDKVSESTDALVRAIRNSNIIMLPGGFSGGDEPDGSAKFITSLFRAPAVTEAVRDLLNRHDGLILGICNGFQALIKLGLVPFGDIREPGKTSPTLTFNTIGRHQSRLVTTRVSSDLSPWMSKCDVGDIHTVAISHGEGRVVADDELLRALVAGGQVATQYVDELSEPSMDLSVNPNGSILAIEGLTSPDGRILGKMGHTERSGRDLYKNVPGNTYQPLIEGGVSYFTE